MPQLPEGAGAAARHPAGDRPDRLRQDHHAVHRAVASSTRRRSRSSPSKTRWNTRSKASTRSRPSRQIGLDFANALRSIVRQDPDIIMIGEMRDLETARIAIQSALTGHLVLSTLHTNNAAGGITRLLDMGVEDYLLTSTVNGILAQRLVRRLEPTHAEKYPASPEEIEKFGLRRFQPQGEIFLYRAVPSALSRHRLPRPHHHHGVAGDGRCGAPRGDAPRRDGRDREAGAPGRDARRCTKSASPRRCAARPPSRKSCA